MEILDTIVKNEIRVIGAQPGYPVTHRWQLYMKANGESFKATYVKDTKMDRLFHKNYADELRITVGFSYGILQDKILPYKDTLEVELVKIALKTSSNPEDTEEDGRVIVKYKAQLMTGASGTVAGDNPLSIAKDRANSGHIQDVELQLFSHVIDKLRKKTFTTVFRDTNPMDAICYSLLKNCNDDGDDMQFKIDGIDIDPTFEPIERKHIVPTKVSSVLELPAAIDDVVGGVHPAQMRYYLFGKVFYFYPIFDYRRWGADIPSLTIIKIPKGRMTGVDKTFRVEGNQVVILTTRETIHQDNSESRQLNEGNGVRFVDSRNVMGDFAKVEGNMAIADAHSTVTEVAFQEREDGVDMVKIAPVAITSRYNKEYAKMAFASGGYIQTFWEYSIPEYLRPGMPVRYIFQDGEETKELYGTLNAVETLDYNTNNTVTEARFITMSLLTIFVSNINPMADEDKVSSVSTTKSSG